LSCIWPGRYFFVPQNAATDTFEALLDTSISQDKIQEWFSRIRARRSLVAYDTCESGSNTVDGSSFRIRQQLAAVEKLSQSTGRTILAATTDTGSAQAGYQGHGLFTYTFLTGLARSDDNHDGQIDVGELAHRALPALSKEAHLPIQSAQVKIAGSNFVLANRASDEAVAESLK
jgi:uncharacterized caspase-like protein